MWESRKFTIYVLVICTKLKLPEFKHKLSGDIAFKCFSFCRSLFFDCRDWLEIDNSHMLICQIYFGKFEQFF